MAMRDIFYGMIYVIVFCLREKARRIRPDLRLVIITATSKKTIWWHEFVWAGETFTSFAVSF